MTEKYRYFWLDRKVDRLGLTGTGLVAKGIQNIRNGVVFLTFESVNPTTTVTTIDNVRKYQCANDETQIVWYDPAVKFKLSWVLGDPIKRISGPCIFTRMTPETIKKDKERDKAVNIALFFIWCCFCLMLYIGCNGNRCAIYG